jgi:signal transduction histidine kinase
MADENLLRRALLNLILNGLRASKPGQSIRVTARRNGGTLSLTVADEGCGISAEDLPRVTEPYFTQFPGGSGLGLPIVERIASAHGWALRIESVLNHGTKSSLVGLSIVEPS